MMICVCIDEIPNVYILKYTMCKKQFVERVKNLKQTIVFV